MRHEQVWELLMPLRVTLGRFARPDDLSDWDELPRRGDCGLHGELSLFVLPVQRHITGARSRPGHVGKGKQADPGLIDVDDKFRQQADDNVYFDYVCSPLAAKQKLLEETNFNWRQVDCT